MRMYQIVDLSTWTVIARGFETYEEAETWGLENDWGQYEEGWRIDDYWVD